MKISLNWLKKYVDVPVPDEELIRLIGARLVEVESVIDERHKYDDIYVVKVEKTEKIPDTHLTLCQINAGGPELIQVVCGAPNVREGMLAVWIKPGAIVPASVHEDAPFVIGKRKMLGKFESNGMLAGADELDFGGKHDKIAEIDPVLAKPGDLLFDIFDLNDLILEIENKSLTHRPDAFGIIGFAREVAGILGIKFSEPTFLLEEKVFPEDFLTESRDGIRSIDANIQVEIADSTICPRYTCAIIKVNEVTAEDKYLTERKILLAKSGMQTVSKIVDVTNYLMLLTGQPLHAFDYDKFVKVGKQKFPKVIIRNAREGEKIELLDGEEVKCNLDDILITTNDVPVAMAGAMGGKNTEIDDNTKNVLLESATFSLYNLRKTQMAHGIFSEAITRFTKGVPAGGTFNVMAEAIREIKGKPLEICDVFPNNKAPDAIKVTTEEINQLLGTNYTEELIIKTLGNVSFSVSARDQQLEVRAPYWRTDIHIKEDVIEEIGRLLGYDNILPTLPLHCTANKNPMFELKREIREKMLRFGANELLTYSFVSSKLLDNVYQEASNSYKIINSISPELQYVRQSLVPSLLEKTYLNEKLPVDRFAIYEMNKIYQKTWGLSEEGVPIEKNQLGFVVAERKGEGTAFYKAKKYVDALLAGYGINVEYVALKTSMALAKPFEPKRSAEIRLKSDPEVVLGVVGEFKKSVQMNFKLTNFLAGFEIDLDLVLEHCSKDCRIDIQKTKTRDLTVITKECFGDLLKRIEKILQKYNLKAKIIPGAIYQPSGEAERHITVRLLFADYKEEAMKELESL